MAIVKNFILRLLTDDVRGCAMHIEKSIFTNEPWEYDLTDYERIYFGNEFCENNILSLERVNKIIEFIKSKDKKITFVTPYLSDKGIEKIKNILQIIPKGSEIVFNDYGLLKYLYEFTPIFGRLLNKQKRGPRIVDLKDKISKKSYKYFQQSNIPAIQKFLLSKNVKRAELDNVIQGIGFKSKLNLSLYYPYVYISTTRLCMLNDIENLARNKLKISNCKKECQKYLLENNKFPMKLFLKGNTQFYYNEELPKKGYDRLVFIPKIIV